jgi:hypothetical protein
MGSSFDPIRATPGVPDRIGRVLGAREAARDFIGARPDLSSGRRAKGLSPARTKVGPAMVNDF